MERILDRISLFLVRHYLSKGSHKLVAVVGSVGKTTTTKTIATVIAHGASTLSTKLNYNTPRGVAMTVFDEMIPTSRIGWVPVLAKFVVTSMFKKPSFRYLVLELGSDRPGSISEFSFLRPDIAVITAITPEHMEYFKHIEAVAEEETAIMMFSELTIANADLVDKKYLDGASDVIMYGKNTSNRISRKASGKYHIQLDERTIDVEKIGLVGAGGESSVLAAALVGAILGIDLESIRRGIGDIVPVPGRMNTLRGKNSSVLIDDTYNSSPEAVRSALDYIYDSDHKKRIVVLGTMNELGEQSPELHEQVGDMCDPKKVTVLITVGDDANKYIAGVAEKKGVKVVRCNSPVEAAKAVVPYLDDETIVLLKGSQNMIYLEEAVKLLLNDPQDAQFLVRQHDYWPAKKARQFPELALSK